MAYMRQSQGELFRMQSKWELAEQALEEAQGLFQQLGDRSGMAYTRQSQGELFRMQDKWELAKQSLEEALGLFQQVGDQRGLANTHVSRGELFTKLGRFQDAEEAYSEALRLSRNIDYAWGTTTAVVQLAKLISRRGAVRADQDTLEEALKLHRQRKAVAGEIQVLKALGDLEAHGSRHALAYGHYLQALSLAEQHTDLSGTSELYVRAAKVSLAANLPEFGLYWSTHALDLLSIGAVPLPQARLLRVTALQLLADCARSLGYPIANDALRAAWYLALEQRHPDALQFESQLADQVPGFNPSVRPTSEELQALGGRISELMRSHDEGLVLRGIHVRRPFGTA
jgi:tetratricopeptide (TPR) repeat protein